MTPAELLDRLRGGGEIDWTSFEEIVFEAAKKALFGAQADRIEVERHRKGPIDIVMILRQRPLELGGRALAGMSTHTAYIECKHYNRPLEFADAAKVFCVAMKEAPNVLVIVSSSDMAPQAWEYARYFFSVDESRGIFSSIHFDHRLLTEFLGLAPTEVPLPPERAGSSRTWVLRASDAFTNRVIARSEALETGSFDIRSTYTLEITPGACTHTFAVANATETAVELRLSGACSSTRRRPNRKTSCSLRPGTLAFLTAENARVVLNVDCETSGQFTVAIGNAVLRTGRAVIDDMRPQTTASWIARLVDPGGPNIIAITGEGGVGKTHFCRRLCEALHEQRGYRCMTVTATAETSESVLFRVLWWLIVPEFGESVEPPDHDLLVASLSRLLADDRRADAELVTRMIESGDVRYADMEVLTYLCARLLSQNPTPRALLVSNAHHLAPHVLRAFELLLSAIADQGWGDTRIFLEYRAGEETARLHELIDGLRSHHDRFAFIELWPLDEPELAVALAKWIDAGQQNDLARAITRKAGGNALFVTNIILWAVDEGFITRSDGQQRVSDWPGLERELERLPPDLDRFLGDRVTSVLARTDDRIVLPYLIAGAFAGFEIDEEQVRRTTALTPAECESARLHLCAKGIVAEPLAGQHPTFAHEIMMLSARSSTSEHVQFGAAARDVLGSLDRDIFADTLLGGRLGSALSRRRTAFDFYNRGYELARNTSAFHLQCLALDGAHGVLESSHAGSEDLTRRFVEVTLALAEAELLGGSMVRANRALHEILETASRAEEAWPVHGETKSWRCRALSNRIQLFVRLMKPREALQAFSELLSTLGESSGLPPVLRGPMTRILLTLVMASRPGDARIVAGALLKVWDAMPSNEQSSLCSDIGRIYLQTEPEIAADWWNRGVPLATEVRQRVHSRLNAFVVELLRGVPTPVGAASELRRTAAALGVNNQLARIDIAEAVLAVGAGDHEQARHLLNVALRLSRSTSQVFWEWKALNNLGVLAVKDTRYDEAVRLFDSALSMTQELRAFANCGPLATDAFLPLASSAGISSDLPPAPQRSGMWHVLVHNAEVVRRREALPLDPQLAAIAHSPLRVPTLLGSLYLALE